ncbi:MAG: beta-lactamase family protein [Xanthomonadales bacterium]|nr:beta-lactamase family protein [Xanthomonadales bacterium]
MSDRWRLAGWLPALILLIGGALPSSAPIAVESTMDRYDGKVPGASWLVVKDGQILAMRATGMADLEASVAATTATNYRLASISKQFTAAAILLLVEDGKLRLDDRLRSWLPELPPATASISLHQVLTHSSGLLDYEELMNDQADAQVSDQDVLDILSQANRLYFEPGSGYRYSNSGYVLLGLVIERASGQRLPAYLKQHIFGPLGMHGTLLYEASHGPEVPHRAFGYSDSGNGWQRTDQSPTSATRGDGGIYSSVRDLALWNAALDNNRLLSASSRELASAEHSRIVGEDWDGSYGYGWRLTGDTQWHSGETIGFRNVIVRWPAQRLTVIILSNRNDPEPYATALAVGQRELDADRDAALP